MNRHRGNQLDRKVVIIDTLEQEKTMDKFSLKKDKEDNCEMASEIGEPGHHFMLHPPGH